MLDCILANWPLEHIYLTTRHFSTCMDLALDTFLHNSCFYNTYDEFQELLEDKKKPQPNEQKTPSKSPQNNKKTPNPQYENIALQK